jgi:hypothetical protein
MATRKRQSYMRFAALSRCTDLGTGSGTEPSIAARMRSNSGSSAPSVQAAQVRHIVTRLFPCWRAPNKGFLPVIGYQLADEWPVSEPTADTEGDR